MMTIKQGVFLFLYIVAHMLCSLFAVDLIDKEPVSLIEHVTGAIGFALYFLNLPFAQLTGGSNLILHSAVASVIYGIIIVFTYKAAVDK